MQKGYSYILLIFFAFVLVVSIVFAQNLTGRATEALQRGNVEAVETLKNNNGMQQLVNLSFDLQSRFRQINNIPDDSLHILDDSLTLFGYNANVLDRAIASKGSTPDLHKLADAVDAQLTLSYNILDARQKKDLKLVERLTDSLHRSNPMERVYNYGVLVENFLERQLQQTLATNSAHSNKLSVYNRNLAIAAIIVVLIFTTLIIVRQWQQLLLIKELKAARELAINSKNAKDEFLANMSHELRTPLNSLIGFGNLLSDTTLNSLQKEYTNTILSNGYNLLHVVNDILDFSSIEAGKLRIKGMPFNLQEIFKDLERIFSAIVMEKKLSYKWHIDPETPEMLKGDPQRLKQVLINLINNAIKFTSQGRVSVYVRVLPSDSSNTYRLEFTVADTGEGIPEEKIDAIFERFEQVEHATTRQYGGTGLGLSIVKSIVERMGGTVSVKSKPGSGSTFVFTGVFEKPAVAANTANKAEQALIADFSGFTALVVEDNAANRLLIKHLLKKYRLNIEVAENGLEALDKVQKKTYDLILMDIQMPQMNGYNAISAMREELQINTPAIAMTAYVMENEIKRCFTAGFNDYIAKPIEEKEMITKIEKYLSTSPSDSGPVAAVNNDLDFFRELIGGDEAVMREVLMEIKKQWKQDKAALKLAVKSGNTQQMDRILHRAKSTFSAFGPNHMILKLLNEHAAGNNMLERIIKECDRIVNQIDQEGGFTSLS